MKTTVRVIYYDGFIGRENSKVYDIYLASSSENEYRYEIEDYGRQIDIKYLEWEADHDDYWHMARRAFERDKHEFIMNHTYEFRSVEVLGMEKEQDHERTL